MKKKRRGQEETRHTSVRRQDEKRSGDELESASEKKVEVRRNGNKKKKIRCFHFNPIQKIPHFQFNSKTRKTAFICFLIHI